MRWLATLAHDSVLPVTTDLNRVSDRVRVVVHRCPDEPEERRSAIRALAARIGWTPRELEQALDDMPTALPVPLDPFGEASAWLEALAELGFKVSLEPCSDLVQCSRHPQLLATDSCDRCKRSGCSACLRPAPTLPDSRGKRYCSRCRTLKRVSRGFFLARVSLLLTVLVLVGVWGYGDVKSRHARTAWGRTLSVAVVVVTTAPVDPASVAELERRLPVLEDKLAREFGRYREGPRPFRLVLHGTTEASLPPAPPSSLLDLPRHSYQQWAYLSKIDEAVDLDAGLYDSRLYLVASPPAQESIQFVEGYSQHGGRVGIVEVELSKPMVDMVLHVAAHELLHTLGAEDKYDASGRTLIPEGLAEPDKVPLLPQRYVEVMSRNRPIDATTERPLDTLDELRVGARTAEEIGWLAR